MPTTGKSIVEDELGRGRLDLVCCAAFGRRRRSFFEIALTFAGIALDFFCERLLIVYGDDPWKGLAVRDASPPMYK